MSEHVVVIAGGGPVGLVNALALARQGIPVTVLERASSVPRAPRAMTYHWSALYGLADLGLLEPMKRAGFLVYERNFHIWITHENVTHQMAPLQEIVKYPYNLTLGQDKFAEVVLRQLQHYPHVSVLWRHEVTAVSQTADRVDIEVTADGHARTLSAQWLIGADGGSSTVRDLLGLQFGGLTWSNKFVATNVRYNFDDYHGMVSTNYLVDPQLGAVVAKVQQDGLWRVTWSEDAGLTESGLDARIVDYLETILPSGAKYEVVSKALYRMHQRAAETLKVGRVVLAGDAAHATNPTSGFGLVGGLHDSYVLSDALAAIIQGNACETVLDQYSEDRLTAFWTVSSPVSTESKRLVFHSDDPDRLEVDMKMHRRIGSTPALLRNYWLQGRQIETPSVVTGEYLSAGRNDPSTAST